MADSEWKNKLYFGDNLDILRKHVTANSVDLIYLDPPFNSNATYNVLFKEPSGEPSEAQIAAFEDTWQWGEESRKTFTEIVATAPASVVEMMKAFRGFIHDNAMMAYLTMMCIRLLELKRVLKDTGAIYLHCDPKASHYLKIVMDTVFGVENFMNEIVWRRSTPIGGKVKSKMFPRDHDIIFFYKKSEIPIYKNIYLDYSEEYKRKFFYHDDGDGRGKYMLQTVGDYSDKSIEEFRKQGIIHETKTGNLRVKQYLNESKGILADDVWVDIRNVRQHDTQQMSGKEYLGYPTQKPQALLERIIEASSKDGDLVLDPFCGCGTALVAAQHLNRRWIGIDITYLATATMKWRLNKLFGLTAKKDYDIIGEPTDLTGAIELAKQDRYQFQYWAVDLVGGQSYRDKKKGADTGIDGYVYFMDEKDKPKKAIVQVKSGGVSVNLVRDLIGVVQREKAEIGIFISLEAPTKPMETEAISQDFYRSPLGKDYPKIQILTIEELLKGKKTDIPPWVSPFETPITKNKNQSAMML